MDSNSQNNVIGVPPPPAEVKVRTMKSDIESMAKSGGGLPQFQNVSVAGLRVEREAPGAVAAPEVAERMARAAAPIVPSSAPATAPVGTEVDEGGGSSSHNLFGIILVIIVAILAIAAVVYFATH
jgi:hypothetical protein